MGRNSQGPHQDMNSINSSMIIQTSYKMKIDTWLIDYLLFYSSRDSSLIHLYLESGAMSSKGCLPCRCLPCRCLPWAQDHGHKTTVLKSHPKEYDFFSY